MIQLPSWAPFAPGLLLHQAKQGALQPWLAGMILHRPPAPLDLKPRVAEAWFPAVFGSQELPGLLLRVRAGGPGVPLDRAQQDKVWSWIERATDCIIQQRPTLVLVDAPAHPPVSGASLEVAAVLAALSSLLGRAPRRPIIASGCLDEGDDLAHPVQGLTLKRRIVALEAPKIELWSPEYATPLPIERWLGPTWRREVLAHQVLPDQLAEEAKEAYAARNYERANQQAEAALAATVTGRALGIAQWIRAACALHEGRAEHHLEALLEARDIVAGYTEEQFEPQEIDAYLGVALIDLGRPLEARRLLRSSVTNLERPAYRGARYKWVALQVAGTLHRAQSMDGDLHAAAATLDRWSLGLADRPRQRARCLGDRAEVSRRMGNIEDASRWLTMAQQALPHAHASATRATQRYLELFQARVDGDKAVWAIEEPNVRDWPQPLEVAESLLANGDVVAWLVKHQQLGALPHRMVWAGVLARWMVRSGEGFPEALRPLLNGLLTERGVEGGVHQALRAMMEGRAEEWAVRCPY